MKYWTIRYTQLWKDPTARSKVCDMPKATILQDLGEVNGSYIKVAYQATRRFEGWVNILYLEPLAFIYPESVVINNQTVSEQDLAQYMMKDGNIQYNLCGELCICELFGVNLDTLLEHWEKKPASAYNRIFYGGRSRTTGIADLIDMASSLGEYESVSIKEGFQDPITKQILFSPGRLQTWLSDRYGVILGVKIETRFGRLRPSGTPHWISVINVIPDGPDNAQVLLYNPAPNRPETYPWYDFISSVGNPYGVIIRQKET